MKVYIVTSGTYSDYNIEAVFSTEENAKVYIDKYGDSDDRRIEEYDVDTENIERETAKYTVHISPCDTSAILNYTGLPDTIQVFDTYDKDKIGYAIIVETDGAERAKKIASERLMQVKAMPYLFPRLTEKCVGHRVYPYYTNKIQWYYPIYNFHTKEIILNEGEFLKK